MTRQAVFDTLAALLRPYADRLSVKIDDERQLYLEESVSTGKPQMFAAVQAKASYIALHVFPLYVCPALLGSVSATLLSRMQGKSCFNFKTLDQLPETEVADLLQAAFASLEQKR
jgi:hypothetical protein